MGVFKKVARSGDCEVFEEVEVDWDSTLFSLLRFERGRSWRHTSNAGGSRVCDFALEDLAFEGAEDYDAELDLKGMGLALDSVVCFVMEKPSLTIDVDQAVEIADQAVGGADQVVEAYAQTDLLDYLTNITVVRILKLFLFGDEAVFTLLAYLWLILSSSACALGFRKSFGSI